MSVLPPRKTTLDGFEWYSNLLQTEPQTKLIEEVLPASVQETLDLIFDDSEIESTAQSTPKATKPLYSAPDFPVEGRRALQTNLSKSVNPNPIVPDTQAVLYLELDDGSLSLNVKVKASTRFSKVFDATSSRMGIAGQDLTFTFDQTDANEALVVIRGEECLLDFDIRGSIDNCIPITVRRIPLNNSETEYREITQQVDNS